MGRDFIHKHHQFRRYRDEDYTHRRSYCDRDREEIEHYHRRKRHCRPHLHTEHSHHRRRDDYRHRNHDKEVEKKYRYHNSHKARYKGKSSIKEGFDIPFDIICNILSRVSIKSLARFRTVSKACNSLTQNPYFINLRSKNCPSAFIFSRLHSTSDADYPPMMKSLYITEKSGKDKWETTRFPLENQLRHQGLEVVATCNGLLCLVDLRKNPHIIHIYSPITRDHITLPKLTNTLQRRKQWFGFDAKTNKYKVLIMLSAYKEKDNKVGFCILTLGETQWRELIIPKEFGVIADCLYWYRPAFLDGEFYWIVGGALLAMDICTEEFRIIKLFDICNNTIEIKWGGKCLVSFRNHVSVIFWRCYDMQIWDLVDSKLGIWNQDNIIDFMPVSVDNLFFTTKDDDLMIVLYLESTPDRIKLQRRLFRYNRERRKLTPQSLEYVIPCDYDLFPFVPTLSLSNQLFL